MEDILITGANGEIGHSLIPKLISSKKDKIITLDTQTLDTALKKYVDKEISGNILDTTLLEKIFSQNKVSTVFHLAAILSSGAEKNPELAQKVNAQGTAGLLEVANTFARKIKRAVKFIFPSTIAVYGIPNVEIKNKIDPVKENEYLNPITIYGINKLYCEQLGIYYSRNYRMLDQDSKISYLDFRCLRFPGIISAITLPSGGTSDYAPQMIHSAARGEAYEAFVRKDTKIPFMVMPDCIKAILTITDSTRERLKTYVYNVTSFTATAFFIENLVKEVFPKTS